MAANYSRDTAAIPGDTAAIPDVHQFLRCPILPSKAALQLATALGPRPLSVISCLRGCVYAGVAHVALVIHLFLRNIRLRLLDLQSDLRCVGPALDRFHTWAISSTFHSRRIVMAGLEGGNPVKVNANKKYVLLSP